MDTEEIQNKSFFKNSVKINRSSNGVSYFVQCSGDDTKEVMERLHGLNWDVENEADEIISQGKGKSYRKKEE